MRRLNAQFDFLGDPADVLIHPEDGVASGVVDGKPVTVRSAHGELTGIAKLDPAIRRGAVSVPHGHVEANVNALTDKDDIDLITGMVRYSGVPVSLHPVAMTEKLRVVQWATGNIGRKALRGIIEHPGLTLAGVHVYDRDKVGRDAGELCGLTAVGVAATGRIEDVLALDADCVLYMARSPDIDEICQLLESGANVVATCGQFYHPPSMDFALKSRVEAACKRVERLYTAPEAVPGLSPRRCLL